MKKFRIAIMASGNGTNAGNIIRYFAGHKHIEVAMVLCNNPDAFVLQRAAEMNIPSRVFTRDELRSPEKFLAVLREKKITHIVLAGFLWLIPDYLVQAFPGRIVNIHPALLPKYGGKGMYGLKVHEAVKASAELETGITIHLVNEKYDEGKVLFQTACPLERAYSAEQIAACVHQLEYEHYPPVIEKWILEMKI
jgi:phosphoribosylglycinamide formyltransferase 1